MNIQIKQEDVIVFLLIIVSASVILEKTIEALKAKGTIDDGKAGYWNEGLSYGLSIIGFIIRYLGGGDRIQGATDAGLQFATLIVTGFFITILTRVIHGIHEWIRNRRQPVVVAGSAVKVGEANQVTVNQK